VLKALGADIIRTPTEAAFDSPVRSSFFFLDHHHLLLLLRPFDLSIERNAQ
jgi:hypothetical protein